MLPSIESGGDNEMTIETTTSYAVIAIVTVTIVSILLQQQAEAAGCPAGSAINATKGRCFGWGP
jgi:hypothetical protein